MGDEAVTSKTSTEETQKTARPEKPQVSDDESEEEVGAPTPTGLLEQDPLSLASGKRDRKATTRLADTLRAEKSDVQELTIPEGSGEKLGDIETIEEHITKTKSDDDVLKKVHQLLFKKPSKKTTVKRHIRAFNGYPESELDSAKESLMARVAKLPSSSFTNIMEFFALQKSGKKEEKIERLVEFLLKPSKELMTGRKASVKSTKTKTKPKAKAKATDSTKDDKEKKLAKLAKQVEELQKALGQKETGTKKRKAKDTATKSEKSTKTASNGSNKKRKVNKKESNAAESDHDEKDQDPLEVSMREAVANVLKEGDHEETTVGQIRKKVEEALGKDLSEHKSLLKTIIHEQLKELE